ncbi:MAG TPA: DUF2059 domain-containing protein [Rubrivivax sp.]|nr:DUF2059 domain-containing protein [Burkholderiales bacterium]HNT39395.1 DUF2059 domain-containing protein [Rubrivivax sp.]
MKRNALKGGLLAATLALAQTAWAQTPPATAPVSSASSASSAAKKALAAKIVKLQQPGIDMVARQLVEQPVLQMLQQVNIAMQQRVAPERRQALAADIQADARKYAEEMGPLVRDKATRIAPGVLQPMLEEKFTEDELKQIIAIIESPVNRKYQALGPELQRTLAQKLVEEMKPAIEPRFKALAQSVQERLQPAGAASAPANGK